MAYRVECVNIDENSDHDDCRCIEEIGIPAKRGDVNLYTPEEIHDRIQSGDEFFVEHEGERTFLIPVDREGTKYVRTEQNDTSDDNLLQQDPCP